jgi:hypothetical protein
VPGVALGRRQRDAMANVERQRRARGNAFAGGQPRQRQRGDLPRARPDVGVDGRQREPSCEIGVRGKSVSRAEPGSGWNRHIGRRKHRGVGPRAPPDVLARIGGDVDFVHPRVVTRDHVHPAVPIARGVRERLQRRHGNHGQIGAEREPLHDAAAETDAGERSRSCREREPVERGERRAGLGQHCLHQRQHALGVVLPGALLAETPRGAVADGDAAPLSGRLEREDAHAAILLADTT